MPQWYYRTSDQDWKEWNTIKIMRILSPWNIIWASDDLRPIQAYSLFNRSSFNFRNIFWNQGNIIFVGYIIFVLLYLISIISKSKFSHWNIISKSKKYSLMLKLTELKMLKSINPIENEWMVKPIYGWRSLRMNEANEVPINSHIWVTSRTFKQL